MKLIVTGYARHGKDSACYWFTRYGRMRFTSSSLFVARKAVQPWLEARGFIYENFDAMYADRVNHRADWYEAIADYCKDDPARLGRELFAENDIYCGLRNRRELIALCEQGIANYTIWVDASKRLPPEPESSITIRPKDADYILDNNGSEYVLPDKVRHLWDKINGGLIRGNI